MELAIADPLGQLGGNDGDWMEDDGEDDEPEEVLDAASRWLDVEFGEWA